MADVVNLRQARKRKDRADKAQQAAENRAKFGRTKGAKARDEADAERVRRQLDQARVTRDE
jgi:hypothetical protein